MGEFTALINQGGATSGYNGGGPWAHAQILTCLDDYNISLEEAHWSDWEEDYPNFTRKINELDESNYYMGELAKAWGEFLSYYVWYSLPSTHYKPSEQRLGEVTND